MPNRGAPKGNKFKNSLLTLNKTKWQLMQPTVAAAHAN